MLLRLASATVGAFYLHKTSGQLGDIRRDPPPNAYAGRGLLIFRIETSGVNLAGLLWSRRPRLTLFLVFRVSFLESLSLVLAEPPTPPLRECAEVWLFLRNP